MKKARVPKGRFTLTQLLKNVDPDRSLSTEEIAILNIAPVGREIGSKDYERLLREDSQYHSDHDNQAR